MGTYLRITIISESSPAAHAAARAAFDAAAGLDSALSIYRPGSDFSRINESAGRDTVEVSARTMEVLLACGRFHDLTHGAFDPSIGPLMRLWKLQGEGNVPAQAEIDSVLNLIGFAKVFLDPATRRVYLPSGMRLDAGAIGKGCAADIARFALAQHGVTRCMVDLGGNVATLGKGPTRGVWAVGIRDPLHHNRLVGSLEINDAALATSGQYEQYFVRDGIRYGHIVDPRTGRPADDVLSVTILAADATTTDALSTGVFVLGPGDGMALVERMPGVETVIVTDPGAAGCLTRDHVRLSGGLRGKIRWAIS